ncbi:hypothetical protein H2200_003368 [Cladophialophora chaetospira]|uniref:Uncharacterized protein n=1 Tax=Cladophialophora chaetospira TaxID=386627 RepID=A0AA38XHX6_9EURO|nr:hypothetical protein H2200_003368 [Cladophialophora chaetospira]
MAQLLAPYNNSMRLGQGFNSYTQQICIDNAVARGPPQAARNNNSTGNQTGVSQIVSYSSRFVEKLSDITDSMNISASMSIKTNTIGGSASGSFVDSDKFKESDLNFFIQVKVVNQSRTDHDYTEFMPVSGVPRTRFTDVYGPASAILTKYTGLRSVYEKLGEVTPLGSRLCENPFNPKWITLKGQANFEVESNRMILEQAQIPAESTAYYNNLASRSRQTEPEALVPSNPPKALVNSDLKTSQADDSNKPVHASRQEGGAIGETQKPSLLESQPSSTVETPGDSGQLQPNSSDPKLSDLPASASSSPLPHRKPSQEGAHQDSIHVGQNVNGTTPSNADKTLVTKIPMAETKPRPTFQPSHITFEAYPASLLGLDRARRDCRLEMIKIINEVDDVTGDPLIASRPDRDGLFLSPTLFKQMLPILKSPPKQQVEDATAGELGSLGTSGVEKTLEKSSPRQTVIEKSQNSLFTGSEYLLYQSQVSVAKHALKAKAYRMSQWAGLHNKQESGHWKLFNDLDILDPTYKPASLVVWMTKEAIVGVAVKYHNGEVLAHGLQHQTFMSKELIIESPIVQVTLVECTGDGVPGELEVTGLTAFMADGSVWNVGAVSPRGTRRFMTLVPPEGQEWELRGFWGYTADEKTSEDTIRGPINRLGVIWSKDIAAEVFHPAIESLPRLIKDSVAQHADKAGSFRLGDWGGDQSPRDGPDAFNSLQHNTRRSRLHLINVHVDADWIIGLRLTYTIRKDDYEHEQEQFKIGTCDPPSKFQFECDNIIGIRFGFTRYGNAPDAPSFLTAIDTVSMKKNQFSMQSCQSGKANKYGHTSLTSLGFVDGVQWTLQGFYGQVGNCFDRIGAVWGQE